MKKKSMYSLFLILQSILYGFGNSLTQIAYGSVSAFWCLFLRFLMAFCLFMILFGKRIKGALNKNTWKSYLPSGLCMAVAYISCNIALEKTTATNVGFLMSLPVLFTPFLGAVILKKPLEKRKLPIRLVTLLGVYLLCCNGQRFHFGWGDFYGLVTAVAIAGALVFGEKMLQTADPVTLSAVQAGITALLSLLCVLLLDDLQAVYQIRLEAWGVIVYLAVGCTVVAYLLQNIALEHLESVTVSVLQCTQPILTAVIAYALLGDVLYPSGIAGGVLIVVSILLDQLPQIRIEAPAGRTNE